MVALLVGNAPQIAEAAAKIGSGDIKDDAVKIEHIAADAVGSVQLRDQAVQNSHIAGGAISGRTIARGAIAGRHVARGAIENRHITDDSIAIGKLAFDPATQAELDAVGTTATAAQAGVDALEGEIGSFDDAGGTANDAGNPIHWNQLQGIPADINDGDDGGGSPAIYTITSGPHGAPTPGAMSDDVSCNGGDIAIAGGVDTSAAFADFEIQDDYRLDDDTWRLRITNSTANAATVTFQVICMDA